MDSWQQALAHAEQETHWAVGMCDNFVANMYGFSASGYNTAVDNWNAVPGGEKHPGDMKAPAGALMFWGGGSSGDGHVAISDGQGGIVSTDIGGPGTVSHVSATDIANRWGLPYLGWSLPYFDGQSGSVGGVNGNATNASVLGGIGGTVLDTITSAFGSTTKDLAERLGLLLMGAVLVLIGISQFGGKNILQMAGGNNAKEGREKAIRNSQETGIRKEEN